MTSVPVSAQRTDSHRPSSSMSATILPGLTSVLAVRLPIPSLSLHGPRFPPRPSVGETTGRPKALSERLFITASVEHTYQPAPGARRRAWELTLKTPFILRTGSVSQARSQPPQTGRKAAFPHEALTTLPNLMEVSQQAPNRTTAGQCNHINLVSFGN